MAEALGLALANQRLRDALLEKALFDPLTGLRNRHHLEDTLHTQMTQAIRNGEPLSCMMIDIDHFKSINDRFGHEAGDQVIKSVSSIVKRAVRENGLAFRFGGEEFLILLPGVNEEVAFTFANEIFDAVHALTVRSGLTKSVQLMSLSESPATLSMPKATTCYARQMLPYTVRRN
jgi:diguanylate cyclase (GGDEF)-like protein